MNRRDFLRTTGAAALTAIRPARSRTPRPLPQQDPLLQRLSSASGNIYPYDRDYFEASERFVFLSPNEASLNVIPKAGKSLDLRVVKAKDGISIDGSFSASFTGVDDSLDIPLVGHLWQPQLTYRLEYRESGKGSWKSTLERHIKTPFSYTQTGVMEIILIGDDHTYDDADMGQRIVSNPLLREARLNGDYVNMYLDELQHDPNFIPDPMADSGKMMSGFCLASTIHQVLKNERPDFILLLGDSTGIGAAYKWSGLGLKGPDSGLTEQDYDNYSKLFWLRMRKMFSALSPCIPIYLVQGNHDGESSYDTAKFYAKKYRKKYFRQPGIRHGGSIDENYFPMIWGADFLGGRAPLFIILDNESYNQEWMSPTKLEDWTLGKQQKDWLKTILTYETDWKFSFFHHVLGGWPRGTNESLTDYAYGRGPLFTYEDYRHYCADPNLVEQVSLTQMMLENRLNVLFYGHDHIFHARSIQAGAGHKTYGICVGSTKHKGELDWYQGPLWNKHYGTYGRYWTEPSAASPTTTFWSPSGYTKITLTPGKIQVEYKRGAFNHPYANLSPSARPGDAIHTLIL
jgi:predicted phosphodiesterase